MPIKVDDRAVFAANLEALRLSLGYDSPARFARRIGYTPRNYLCYERGQRSQDAALLRIGFKLADEFGVSLDWLFDRDSPMFRPGRRIKTKPKPTWTKVSDKVLKGPWGSDPAA
jgi:transcriptional regulator with XRE-family HTH domain